MYHHHYTSAAANIPSKSFRQLMCPVAEMIRQAQCNFGPIGSFVPPTIGEGRGWAAVPKIGESPAK
jgi:hypothetical protein